LARELSIAAVLCGCTGDGRLEEPESSVAEALGAAIQLGRGYDRAHESVAGDCLAFRPTTGIPEANGYDSSFVVSLVEGRAQLRSALQLGVEADAAAWVGAVREELAFMDAVDLRESRLHFLVTASARRRPTLAVDLSLLPAARAALASGGIEAFERMCGDGFVASTTMGTAYGALFSVETADAQDRMDLSSRLSVEVSGARVETGFAGTFDRLTRGRQVSMVTFQRGGVGADQARCDTVACAIDRAKAVGDVLTAGSGVLESFATQTYPALAERGDDGGTAARARRLEVVSRVNEAGDDARDLLDVLHEAKAHPEYFERSSLDDLDGRIERAARRVEQIERAKRGCFEVNGRCEVIAAASASRPVPRAVSACRRLSIACKAQAIDASAAALVDACIAERGRPLNLRTCQ
jgi:hypothetical protein